MQIFINGDPHETPEPTTVAQLLAALQLTPQRVAIEVNEKLVRRGEFERVALAPRDRVEIVTLVGGG